MAKGNGVVLHDDYPKSEGRARPFHLWDANERKQVRGRCYGDVNRAHDAALVQCRQWSGIKQTIEVYNAKNGKLLGQYTRRINHVDILEF